MLDYITPPDIGDRVTYNAAAFTGTVVEAFFEDGRRVVRIRFDNGTFLVAYADDGNLDRVPDGQSGRALQLGACLEPATLAR